MSLKLKFDGKSVDWNEVVNILIEYGMPHRSPEVHKRAFYMSHPVLFVYSDNKLVGFGRAISDGEYQAAIYDVAVLPSYQRKGIGKLIVSKIIDMCPNCDFILFASNGSERFYEKLNFKSNNTGMILSAGDLNPAATHVHDSLSDHTEVNTQS